MKRRFIVYGCWIIGLLLIQESVFIHLKIFEAMPSLIFSFVYVMAFKSKIREALVIGLITGLLMDCLYGSLIGPYAILLMYLAVISSLINHGPLKDKIIYLLLMALPCSILFIFGDAFLSSLLKMMISGSGILFTNFFLTVKTIIFPRIWYTYIMFFVLFFPLYMSKKFVSKMDAKLFAEKNYGGWKG